MGCVSWNVLLRRLPTSSREKSTNDNVQYGNPITAEYGLSDKESTGLLTGVTYIRSLNDGICGFVATIYKTKDLISHGSEKVREGVEYSRE